MGFTELAKMAGDSCYVFLAINFFWGLYCVIMGWRRVNRLTFRNRDRQVEFLDQLMPLLKAGKFDEAKELADDDVRALPQLAVIAIENRDLGYEPMRQQVMELLQHDILSDLDYRTGWIATVIKCGPLLGLFGTVLGMMAAFGRIGSGDKVEPYQIAEEISIALVCTAMGLVTAIPFNLFLASINNRVRRLKDSLTAGLARIFDFFKHRPRATEGTPTRMTAVKR